MLDFDLAEIYGIETRGLKQTVRRNLKRFEDEDFMFEVTKEELSRSQFVTLNKGRGGNIMRAFVAVRSLILNPPGNEEKQLQSEVRALKEYVEDVFTDQNDINEDTRMQLELINQALAELQTQRQTPNPPRRRIGYRTSDEDEFI